MRGLFGASGAGLFFSDIARNVMPQNRTRRQGFDKSPQALRVGQPVVVARACRVPMDSNPPAVSIATARVVGVARLFLARPVRGKHNEKITV